MSVYEWFLGIIGILGNPRRKIISDSPTRTYFNSKVYVCLSSRGMAWPMPT